MIHEVNFDGLPGPTHSYAGLAMGNMASIEHAKWISNPQQAALDSLSKMRYLLRLGLPQGILFPHARPAWSVLHNLELVGSDQQQLETLFKQDMNRFAAIFSSSAMWAANAATVTASIDAADNVIHITPANLATHFHRSIEAIETYHQLMDMFPSPFFQVHEPLPDLPHIHDEGAANHMRFSNTHANKGINVFVYGKNPQKFPARQSREASVMIAETHHIDTPIVFLEQNPDAIDAGVFHNDVIAINNENVFIYHEKAYVDRKASQLISSQADIDLRSFQISNNEMSLKTVVETYFFNSQLITANTSQHILIMPVECKNHPEVDRVLSRLIAPTGPIHQTHYVECRQSMQNGGGPACLRLRVPMSDDALASVNQRHLLNEKKIDQLEAWVKQYYRDRLMLQDFLDPAFRKECDDAMAHFPL